MDESDKYLRNRELVTCITSNCLQCRKGISGSTFFLWGTSRYEIILEPSQKKSPHFSIRFHPLVVPTKQREEKHTYISFGKNPTNYTDGKRKVNSVRIVELSSRKKKQSKYRYERNETFERSEQAGRARR